MIADKHDDSGKVPLVSFWVREVRPDGSHVLRPGRIIEADDEIGTAEASRILGVAQRTVQFYCDRGVLVEGREWRKNPSIEGRGQYRIKRDAVLRLRLGV